MPLQHRWLNWVKAGSPAPAEHTVGFRGPLRNWLFGGMRNANGEACYGAWCPAPVQPPTRQSGPMVRVPSMAWKSIRPAPAPRPIPPRQPRVNVPPHVDRVPELIARIEALTAQLEVLESKQPPRGERGQPGEPGLAGAPGRDGANGKAPTIDYDKLAKAVEKNEGDKGQSPQPIVSYDIFQRGRK